MANNDYEEIPDPKPYRGEDKELREIIDDLRRGLALAKAEIERLQKEKADI